MGQALYRKHRPKSLGGVVGQEHITDTLRQAIEQGRISHAYLFTGPRGVGKTSIARILAHEINGLSYDDDSAHMDIIEIDAASNRRIDEIRELRDKVYVAPSSAKYKVYIIDEVHMLTREAFNALLKTLEEPPAHAVFILATTEAHKLPGTIISRTQRFSFKPVSRPKVAAHLADIAKEEKIKISLEALDLLAEHGEGSFRDSISLLDQLGSQTKQIDAEDVRRVIGVPPAEAVEGLLAALNEGREAGSLLSALNDLFENGYQASGIARQISRRLRRQLAEGRDDLAYVAYGSALNLLKQLIEVPVSHDPEHFLEITLLEALPKKTSSPVPPPSESDVVPEAEPTTPERQERHERPAPAREPASESDEPQAPADRQTGDAPFDESLWPSVLRTLKQQHNTLYGVIRMAKPTFSSDGTLELAFAFAFHQKRIKEAANRQKVADVVYGLTGKKVAVECSLDPSAKPSEAVIETAEAAPDPSLDAISNIFGTAELLES